MKYWIAAGLLMLSVCLGCDYPAGSPPRSEVKVELGRSISYFRDSRTNLCFAVLAGSNGHFEPLYSIANVPCDAPEKANLLTRK